jgi:hypothetical protein
VSTPRLWLVTLVTGATLLACSSSESGRSSKPTCEPDAGTATRESLLWKRGTALTADLARALELAPSELCKELGSKSCLDVHRVALGSSDPFGSGLLEAVPRPLATTGVVTDRVVISACSARVDADEAGNAKVFEGVELGSAPAPDDDPAFASAVGTPLYRRLVGRDPSTDELATLSELGRDGSGGPVSRSDFAKLACFAVATTSEFLLY